MQVLKTWTSALALVWAGACLAASPLPDQLDAYGVLKSDGKTLTLSGNTMVYGLASPLFTDYALKFRTITLPAGAKLGYKADAVVDLPIGTIISKTFYYAKDPKTPGGWLKSPARLTGESIDLSAYQLVETRILKRDTDGSWQANTYIWNDTQTSAALRRIGLTVNGTLRDPATGESTPLQYNVPNARQCQTCHAVDATVGQVGIEPIGPKGRFLNLEYGYTAGKLNQLVRLGQIGTWDNLPADLAALPRNVAYADAQTGTLEARARAYAEINCAHCHNKLGDARQSGLFLTLDATGSHLGVCKQHAAAGSGGANLTFDIVPGKPDKSLLVTRMEATTGQAMMPRMGRSLVDKEGVQLLRQWVTAMNGNCDVR
ncbi:SO2930 family diheme c-type cytochrome [Rhodoferax saidenbachensis]|uniref:Cytochrome c domain-containing protein n=1 Tax=Rhodoferax saidenbachensis TaxID=1484693 RepID=A0A1P8KBF1_9BURK|nr:SO2930 family diheme c-type cytochrome [Rhodoferax saidenbachensis]APW43343.1 hypothetical protein RS694_12930 [Rhodoferax saidenbachensis]